MEHTLYIPYAEEELEVKNNQAGVPHGSIIRPKLYLQYMATNPTASIPYLLFLLKIRQYVLRITIRRSYRKINYKQRSLK